METLEQFLFRFVVPALTKRGQGIESLADTHPRIERQLVRHVGQPALDLHFYVGRIEAEDTHLAALGAEEIRQALHLGGLARVVAAEESLTPAGPHAKAQVMDGLRFAVGVGQIPDVDGWSGRVHVSFLLMFFVGAALAFENLQAFLDQLHKFRAGHLQVMGHDNDLVNLFDEQLPPDFLAQRGVVLLQEASFAGQGLDYAEAFEFGIGFSDGIAVEAKFFRQRPDGGERLARQSAPDAAAALTCSTSWRYIGMPDLKLI